MKQNLRMNGYDHHASPTTPDNCIARGLDMKLLACTMQQLGGDMDPYVEISDRVCGCFTQVGLGQAAEIADAEALCPAIDEGFRVLRGIRDRLPGECSCEQCQETVPNAAGQIDWPFFHGDNAHSGYTGAAGPSKGELQFRVPVALGWQSSPVVSDGVVYVSSPSMKTTVLGFDLKTGDEVYRAERAPMLCSDQLYSTPCNASTPYVGETCILTRDMGSRGLNGQARYIRLLDKSTGSEWNRLDAGHVDYRAGYPGFCTDGKLLVFAKGDHDIERIPALCQPLNRIMCADLETMETLWDINVGACFADPVLCGDAAIVCTQSGYVYALHLDPNKERIKWSFKAEGEVNKAAACSEDYVIFGDNQGILYVLDRNSGKPVFRQETGAPKAYLFRYFGTPLVEDHCAWIPCANGCLYRLDLDSLQLRSPVSVGDPLRARPVQMGKNLFFAGLSGTLYAFDPEDEVLRQKKLSSHPILADLTAVDGMVLVNDSHLNLFVCDAGLTPRFKRSLIDCEDADGVKLLYDQIAGGAYYQSKPTAVGGTVYFGTPAGLLYAIDGETGAVKWLAELSAAISASPVWYKGRLYLGQQGGDDSFYCLDAETGALIWTSPLGWVWGSCNISEGRVFAPGIDGFLNCLDAETGSVLWRYRTDRSASTEPIVYDDMVFFGSWDEYMYALDGKTGKLAWKLRVNGWSDSGAGTAANGRLYIPVNGLQCVDAKTGKKLWHLQLPGVSFNATTAFHDGKIFTSTSRGIGLGGVVVHTRILCLDGETGKLIWSHEGGGLPGVSIGCGKKVYVTSSTDPYVKCLDEEGNGDGTTTCLWRYNMGAKTEEATSCVCSGKLYVMNAGGWLYAIR